MLLQRNRTTSLQAPSTNQQEIGSNRVSVRILWTLSEPGHRMTETGHFWLRWRRPFTTKSLDFLLDRCMRDAKPPGSVAAPDLHYGLSLDLAAAS